MDEALIFWIFKKLGKQRGYVLTSDEWKEFIPCSEKEMINKFDKWQKELRQGAGCKGHQTN